MNINTVLKDAIPIIENAAPLVARAIGNYPALALKYLMPLLAKAFDIDTDDASQIIKNITEKDDAQEKLKVFEHDHKDFLENLIDSFGKLSHAEINVKFDFKQPD